MNCWQETVTLNLKKEWYDASNKFNSRPDSVTVLVTGKANGETVSERYVVMSGTEDEWVTHVTGLPRWSYDETGMGIEIEYTVTEEDVPGYEAAYSCSPETGYDSDNSKTYTIENSLKNEMRVIVQKQWEGGDPDTDMVPVHLYGHGSDEGATTKHESDFSLTKADGWKHTETYKRFTITSPVLGKETSSAKVEQMEYTAWEQVKLLNWDHTETRIQDSIGADGILERTITLVNTRSNTVTISGKKVWQKPNSVTEDELPTVMIKLEGTHGSGLYYESQEVNADNNWQYSFQVPVKDAHGNNYNYVVSEVVPEVDGVTITQVSAEANSTGGKDFTNRWQENVTLNIEKKWVDDGSIRPESITVRVVGTIYGGGEPYNETVELTAADGWKKSLTVPHWYYDESGDVV